MNPPKEIRWPINSFYKGALKNAQAYSSQRIKFIKYCIGKRMSYSDIGKLLHLSKQRVYAISRYGTSRTTGLTGSEKDEVRKRHNNICEICGGKNKMTKLHIHHINNPEDQSPENLVPLCAKCHNKVHRLEIQARKNDILRNFKVSDLDNPITVETLKAKFEQLDNEK